MQKKWLKIKKTLLMSGLIINIPFLVSCNSKEREQDNQKNEVIESEIEEITESTTATIATTTAIPTTVTTTMASEKNEQVTKENETIEYFNETNDQIDELLSRIEEADVQEQIFAKFIELTDFIFCNGEINGVRFDELSESAKQKVKEIHSTIDNKIESKIPGYKDTIKDKYTQIKTYIKNSEFVNKTKDKYTETKEELKDRVDEAVGYENTVDEFWESVEEDYEDVKDMTDKAKQKIKNKYDQWSQQYRK